MNFSFHSAYIVVLTEDDAKLRCVGATRREDLPAAGLEFFGDRAIASKGDLVSRSGHRTELKNGEAKVGGSRNLHCAVHAGDFGGFRRRVGVLNRLGFWLGFVALPPEKAHGCRGGSWARDFDFWENLPSEFTQIIWREKEVRDNSPTEAVRSRSSISEQIVFC